MTPDQRVELLATLISVFGAVAIALSGWAIRALWKLSSTLQEDRDATRANTKALDRLSTQVGGLAERVARLEGPPRRR
jgi:hypothetical protein